MNVGKCQADSSAGASPAVFLAPIYKICDYEDEIEWYEEHVDDDQ